MKKGPLANHTIKTAHSRAALRALSVHNTRGMVSDLSKVVNQTTYRRGQAYDRFSIGSIRSILEKAELSMKIPSNTTDRVCHIK